MQPPFLEPFIPKGGSLKALSMNEDRIF